MVDDGWDIGILLSGNWQFRSLDRHGAEAAVDDEF